MGLTLQDENVGKIGQVAK